MRSNVQLCLYDFTNCCIPQVEAYLCRHPDPSVRLFLAHNGEVSDSTLAALADDIDPGVAQAALRQTELRNPDCSGTAHDLTSTEIALL